MFFLDRLWISRLNECAPTDKPNHQYLVCDEKKKKKVTDKQKKVNGGTEPTKDREKKFSGEWNIKLR